MRAGSHKPPDLATKILFDGLLFLMQRLAISQSTLLLRDLKPLQNVSTDFRLRAGQRFIKSSIFPTGLIV